MDVNLLPVPQSRSETFLDYIARNMNIGGGNGGGVTLPLEIKDVKGLEEALNKRFDSVDLLDDKLSFKSNNIEVSSVPIITTAEIELILNNLT